MVDVNCQNRQTKWRESHAAKTAMDPKQNGAEGCGVKRNGGGSHFDKTAKQNGAELRTFILLLRAPLRKKFRRTIGPFFS